MIVPTLYILEYNKTDNTSKYGHIIQDYESIVWTERYSGMGEFELVLPWSHMNRNLYKVGTFISMDRSHRIMRVSTYRVERDKGLKIVLTGSSLEDIFNYRHIRKMLTGMEEGNKNFTYRDYRPDSILRTMFLRFCTDYYNDDKIRLLQRPIDNVHTVPIGSAPSVYQNYVGNVHDKTTTVVESGSMASFFKKMYDEHRIGVSFLRSRVGRLLFWAIPGRDRTIQSEDGGPPVTFEEYNGDISNVKKLVTSVDENVGAIFLSGAAWAVHVAGGTGGYAIDTRYDMVEVQDDSDDTRVTPSELTGMAKDHTSPLGVQTLISADTTDKVRPIYDNDYILGDIVGLSDPEGGIIKVRVVEYTFIMDSDGGYSEHPTFEDYGI